MAANRMIRLNSPHGRQDELVAAEAISPGHLLDVDSSGEAIKHATAGGNRPRLFALEDALRSYTIDLTGNDYAADDPVQVLWALPGDKINALLTTSQTIVVGDDMTSNADGTLKKDTGSDSIIGIAAEAVTTTAAVAHLAIWVV